MVKQFYPDKSLKRAVGTEDEGGTSEDKDAADEEEQERLEALREAEERRQEKHRKMEEEREKMRQEIRDKYGIKKKEEVQEQDPFADMEGSSLNRKRKTPAELAAEAEAEDQDEFTKLKNSLETQVTELKTQIEGKCNLQ
ncbi:hypothetical protein JTE90_029338 [Oedothorax gibbosus]|uniref:Complexin n=1 Tax=Oedothorax gibbosus TaxID=931172 RepID=A0AAV6UJ20_9ARAC|nr:hypothetical protein JTE90_029338 [Oedothorax gibbosus]